MRTEHHLLTLSSSQAEPADLAFSPDGSRLAEIDPDGTVRLVNTDTGELLLVLEGHETGGQVALTPDGSMLATQGDGMVRIWALDIDDLLKIDQPESDEVAHGRGVPSVPTYRKLPDVGRTPAWCCSTESRVAGIARTHK